MRTDTNTLDRAFTLDEAVAHTAAITKEILTATGLPPTAEVTVLTWGEGPWGVRVSEVSYWLKVGGGGAGGSWMQSDPPAHPVVFAAERLILTLMYPEVGGYDEVVYAETDLRSALDGTAEGV